jgi:H+/Cl- antiporter ClcA
MLDSNGTLDVIGDRALLAAVVCFITTSSATLAAPVVVAELTESVDGCWIDATVFE